MAVFHIISGGQTGADRAALDFALFHGISCGGYCPKGRYAEDGIIDAKYPLVESASSFYQERTKLNIVHSDATALFVMNGLWGKGSIFTKKQCQLCSKPFLIVDLCNDFASKITELSEWILANNVQKLNIAGNREGTSQGIYRLTTDFLFYIYRHTSVFSND